MTPPTPPSCVTAHRTLIRRSALFIVAVVSLGSVPLVAQALTDKVESAAGATAVAIPDEPTVRRASTLPDRDAELGALRRDRVAEPATPAPPAESALDATIRVVTDRYVWDERGPRVEELQKTLGVTVDGWYAHETLRAHRAALEFVGFPTATLPVPPVPPVPSGPSADQWAALRQCESNGNYSITNPSGKYRGAYQFDRSTWNSVASRHAPHLEGVDPAAASPADQDAMALALYSERGHRPWPHCGRHLR